MNDQRHAQPKACLPKPKNTREKKAKDVGMTGSTQGKARQAVNY